MDDFARNQADRETVRTQLLSIAGEVHALAATLDDPATAAALALQGRTMTPDALKPRPAAEPMPQLAPPATSRADATPAGTDAAQSAAFSGTCVGVMTEGAESLPASLVFERQGDRVTGRYTLGVGVGQLQGRVEGSRLHYGWEYGDAAGQGVLQAGAAADRIRGTWGYGTADRGAGTISCAPAAVGH